MTNLGRWKRQSTHGKHDSSLEQVAEQETYNESLLHIQGKLSSTLARLLVGVRFL